jgi:succinate dehydrogenase / fumarate reductase cytochrome b subunit
MRFSWYPGCVAKGAGQELYVSTKKAAEVLGIELDEMKEAACCGAGVNTEDNPVLAKVINARTFSIAEEKNPNIMTICSTCQGVLRKDQVELDADPEMKSRVNGILKEDINREYKGDTLKIRHLLHVLVEEYGLDKLKEKVKRPLKGLKVAPFYGCYLLRPTKICDFPDPDNPDYLEKVIEAVGAEPVEFDSKTKCCGFPIIMMNKVNSLRLSGNVVVDARDRGADCIVTPCPLCHLNLDPYQPEAASVMNTKLNMPVLHLPQLLCLAFGIPGREIRLNNHIIRPTGKLAEFTG